jgi:hypothetical protein
VRLLDDAIQCGFGRSLSDGTTVIGDRIWWLIFAISSAVLLPSNARGQMADEYRVKAAFLYNFARFVTWPSQTFKNTTDPMVICVLGKDDFGESLTQAVSGNTVEGRPFGVRRIADSRQAGGCQILFISSSERKHLADIFAALPARAVLTVGETDSFTSEGGIVNLKMEEGRVRIQINLAAAEVGHLSISAKLLSLAQIVRK